MNLVNLFQKMPTVRKYIDKLESESFEYVVKTRNDKASADVDTFVSKSIKVINSWITNSTE